VTSGPLSRRTIITTLALAVGGALAFRIPPIHDPVAALGRRLASMVSSPQSAARLGLRCLAVSRDYGDPAIAFAHLARVGAASPAQLESMPSDALRTYVRGCVRNDFLARRMIKLDGWMVSQTEAYVLSLSAVYNIA
jgi:hypothetical protein